MASMNGVPDPSFPFRPGSAEAVDLRGRRVAVVGGTGGLGQALARRAAAKGAEVLVVGRTFRDEQTPGLTFLRADLESMAVAERLGDQLPPDLDALVFTTGIMAAPQREVTAEGLERDLAVSTLSRFVTLRAAAPRLKQARVFVLGFPGAGNLGDPDDLAQERYNAFQAHMNTVAGNEALVLAAARRFPHLEIFGVNPGLVKTDIRANYLGKGSFRHRAAEWLIGWLTPTPETWANRLLPLLVAPELRGRSGALFGAKGTPILPSEGMDLVRAERFYLAFEQAVGPILAEQQAARLHRG